MAVKVPKQFVPLHTQARNDPKLITAGPWVELLYYRALQWAKEHPETLGVIPVWALPDIGRGIRQPAARMHEGCTNELWETHERGWRICAWDAWNQTPEEIEHTRERKRIGGLITAHKQGRHKKRAVADCPTCKARTSYSSGSSTGSSSSYSSGYSPADRESTSYGSTTSRTDGPEGGRRRSEPTTTAWPRYDEDWYYDQFRPTDYLLNEHHREEGGWWPDHTSWVQPAIWRDGWNGKGKRPPKGDLA